MVVPFNSEPRIVPESPRPLTDLNRRDLFYLAAGGLGVLFAVGGGYAITSLLKSPKPAASDEEK